MRKTPLRYRLLLAALSPLIVSGVCHQAFFRNTGERKPRGERRRYIKQRLGLSTYRPGPRDAVWLHAASVGEVNAALPLVNRLLEQDPALHIRITTNTLTGAQTVADRLSHASGRVHHAYLPVDFRCAVRRFLNAVRPRCALIMETELWPTLYDACAGRQTPVCLVNARLSRRTLNTPNWARPVLGHCLRNATAILARGETDARHFVELGAPASIVSTTGNIKFAQSANASRAPAPVPLNRPYVLAASTHDGEERMIAAAWQKLDTRNMLLVIAPRYPRRGESIQRQLQAAGASVALRSRDEPVTDKLDVYIADTLGELKGFMREAALVFMGGSLVPRGGQNILEPAQLGKAVVTGPHTFTFEAEVEALQAADALARVDNADQLTDAFRRLLAEPGRAAEIGENARRLCEARAGIADVYAAELERLGFLSDNHGEHGGHGDKK